MSDEITKLIAGGNKIQAIKLVVENYNIGLKEAKDFVEAIEENLKIKK
ncbi:MAG: ribosomal protein L7/L12 [Ignavibacteria bacterium]|nr:ribosomal protein L7/L12 [Ignavibacteria bacterium]